jgi:signal transduction histidine kinase
VRWDELTRAWFLGLGVFFAVLLGLLVAKMRRSRGLGRRETLPPAGAAGGIAVAGLAYVGVHVVDVTEAVRDLSLVVVAVAVATTPVAFLVVAMRRQAARAAVAELVVRLTTTSSGADAVQDALRVAVADPGLRLSYWIPAEQRYAVVDGGDEDGDEESAAEDDRWHAEVRDAEGEPLAHLALDPSLRRQPDLVSAALGAAGLALANGRLHHRVQAQLEEVRASRQRIVTATQAERQRFERAVHDGAQGPLVAVSAALSTVRLQVSGQPEVLAAIERAQDTVRTALGDLRDIARGIHPMVLSEDGLRAALARLAEGQSVPTTIDVPATRLPREVEGAFYYTAAEALTNVVKHTAATHVHVTVRSEPGFARLEVADDGCGGARLDGGTGLAGLRDRARALRGELSVGDGASGGTRVVVTIPCA